MTFQLASMEWVYSGWNEYTDENKTLLSSSYVRMKLNLE